MAVRRSPTAKPAQESDGRGRQICAPVRRQRQYGHVVLTLEPLEPGSGFVFEDATKGGVVPREYIPSVEKGLREAMGTGVLAGYPVVDVKATLTFGSYHDVDSSEMAFRMAAIFGFREGARKADPVILEPVMHVEVETPEEYAGNIMGDLSSRRGMVQGMEERFGSQIIRADVPLAEMFGYSTTLRSMSQGRATYSMEFHHYAEAPRNVADEIIASRAKKLSNVPGCDARRLTRATLVPAPRPGKAKPPPGKKVSVNWGRNTRRRCWTAPKSWTPN